MRAARGLAVAALSAVLLLAGCAGPDPELVTEKARAVFDGLVEQAAETDPAVLRTLEAGEAAEQACTGEDDRSQTAFTATGTLSITADDGETRRIRDSLGDTLDPEEWTTILSAAAEQDAWISEDDVVVALTADGPALVIAVFTPCLPS
ncbi:hypothetical protein [Microbacterium sp. 18062]|uniref:hypothetical protein n=1 Tax=Microbacterium sp. 18062 TaxID=2681410 RepID=UPI0013571BB7|nr:hypothetical protein [Microbacterium sp. 18062]